MNIGICVIAYNRIDSLKRVLKTLSEAYYPQNVDLNISIDKSNTDIVEKFALSYVWTFGRKNVIMHKRNLGLKKHVLSCGELLHKYDALIVLEDDVTVAVSYFLYAMQCVEQYAEDESIAGISLYNFPIVYHNQKPFTPLKTDSDVFLMNCAQSWGQVWMRKQWFAFRKWYDIHCGEIMCQPHLPDSICSWPKSSWLKYHTQYCIEENKYFVYPYHSLSTNNGDVGTHVQVSSTMFQASLHYGIQKHFKLNPTMKYDGFFENKMLYEVLGLDESECCIDFYGEKSNRERKRYWLSATAQPYKIVRSFALTLKPYEMNVVCNVIGEGLYLYDTMVKNEKHVVVKQSYLMFYLFNYDTSFIYAVKKLIKACVKRIFSL